MASTDELKEELEELTKEIKKLREQMTGGGGGGGDGGSDATGAGGASNLDQLKQEEKIVSKMMGAYEKRNKAAQGDNLFNKQKTELLDNQGKQLEKQNAELFKKKDLNEEDVEIQKKQVDLFKKKGKEQDKNNKKAKKAEGHAKQTKDHVNGMFEVFQHKIPAVQTFNKAIEGMKTPIASLSKGIQGIGAAMINNVFSLAFDLIDMENAFMKATGASREFAASLTDTYAATRGIGVTAKENREAWENLRTTFTDFTMATNTQREAVARNSAMLKEMGVELQDSSKLMQFSAKVMGQTTEEGSAMARELAAMGKDIGVTPKQMIGDFTKVEKTIAALGPGAKRAFKDMQLAAKVTGLAIESLVKITEKFDTFDGAAEQAGKLNAALGGNFVNAMDMMMATDPAERFGMIRDSLHDAGLEFDNMSYYQRKMYADSLGLSSVAELAAVMSNNHKDLSGVVGKNASDYEAMADQARTVQSLQEQFNATIAAATPILTDLMVGIKGVVEWMGQNQDVVKSVMYAFMAYKSLMMAVNVVQALTNIKTLLAVAAFSALAYLLFEQQFASNFIDGMWKFVGAAVALGAAMTIMGVIIKKNGVSFTGFSIAALALGAAIYIGSMAVDNLVTSMQRAGPEFNKLIKLIIVVGLIVLGLFMTITALTIKTGGVGVAAIGVFGAAILAMGFGAKLAADAFASLVDTWKDADPNMLWAIAGAVLGLAGAVVAVALAGTAGLTGLAAVAAFVLVLAGAFIAMTTAVVDARTAMANMFSAAGSIDTRALQEMAAQFEAISAAMDEVPLVKVIAWTAIMDKVQIEAPAVRAAAPAAAAAAAGPAMAAAGTSASTSAGQQSTAPERPYNVTINVEMDGSTVGSSTVELLAGKAKAAILGIGG